MSYDVAIIADDLTGAGDTAVQFTEEGWTAELRLRGGETSEGATATVVAVTTDSRALGEDEAAVRVRDAAAELRGQGVTRFFKKVDSTLRGPIRAEIDAALGVLAPDTIAVVCPAFPDVGRTVSGGTLLVDGVPVAETVIGSDPVTPVTVSEVPELLGAPLVRLDPAEAPERWAERIREAGSTVVVLDATDNAGLDRIAAAVAELGDRALPVGSAGLAAALARRWRPREQRASTALVVVTSLNAAAREQAAALTGAAAVRHEPTGHELSDDAAWEGFVGAVLASAGARPRTLLLIAPERETATVGAGLVPRRLADAAARVVRSGEVAGVVVTGGDGARALLDGLGSTGIRLRGHVAPGVALGAVVGGWAAGLPVATKAGGFGGPEVLIKAADAVRENRSDR
ncbi:four-carbon acid sugar kinase family protein [Saccharomonospora sp. NPDC006951]